MTQRNATQRKWTAIRDTARVLRITRKEFAEAAVQHPRKSGYALLALILRTSPGDAIKLVPAR